MPSRDDHTIVDYSIPHYVGAGFGFALYSYSFGEQGHKIGGPAVERMAEYAKWRDPVELILPDPDGARAVEAIRLARDRLRNSRN